MYAIAAEAEALLKGVSSDLGDLSLKLGSQTAARSGTTIFHNKPHMPTGVYATLVKPAYHNLTSSQDQ